ncbi:MAG: hypothetical protein ACLPX9_03595 [Rhodomicrobium sp.]
MNEESLTVAAPVQASCAGRLPLFDQIAQGFLKTLAALQASGEAPTWLDYLDGKVKVDGATYTRRLLVLAIEDLKQQIEAPLQLRSEVYSLMKMLQLDPIPDLRLYRDLATAILRIDAALHLVKMKVSRNTAARNPVYH